MNERHGSFATKSAMPPAFCEKAAELDTMAELVASIDKALGTAVNDLGMVHADLCQGTPDCGEDCSAPTDLTLFDRLRHVREVAGQVSFQAAQIRLRLGKTE